jgi:multiple sugar transport system substrate-binding protein
LVGDLPDVTFQGYDYLQTVVARGLAIPLDSFVAGDKDWTDDKYSIGILHSGTVDGKVYGLGAALSLPVLFYNADLVRAAQGDKPFPTTWPEIIALGQKISQMKSDTLGLYAMYNSWVFQSLLETQGGHLMSPDDKQITFDDPHGVALFDMLEKIGEAGQANMSLTREQSRQSFVAGTLGIMTDASSGLSQRIADVGGRFRIGLAPLPGWDCPEGCNPVAGVAEIMTARDPERQKAAWRFMKFVISVEGQTIIARNSSYLPANAAAIEHDATLKAAVMQYPQIATALSIVPYASAWYAFPGENPVKIDDTIVDAMEMVTTLKEKPAEALEALRKSVEGLL